MNGFPDTAWWRILVVDEENIVHEPVNPSFVNARSPTMNEDDVKYVKQKQNFAEKFLVPVFTGIYNKFVRTKRTGEIKYDTDGLPLTETTTRKEGMPNPKFMEDLKISRFTQSYKYAEIFFPFGAENISLSNR